MTEPDYSTYTLEELMDCKKHIDAEMWPDRLEEIEDRIQSLIEGSSANRSEHNALVFSEFCESFTDDLRDSYEDQVLSILNLFSLGKKQYMISTFQGVVCPICKGEIEIKKRYWHWVLAFNHCNVKGGAKESPVLAIWS